MEGPKVGRSTPSYKEDVASQGKKPIENHKGPLGEGKRNMEEEQDYTKSSENKSTK